MFLTMCLKGVSSIIIYVKMKTDKEGGLCRI